MSNFKQFFVSTRLIIGPGCIDQLPVELNKIGAKHLLIVTDQGLVKAGILDEVLAQLDGFTFRVFDNVIPNPTVDSVDSAYHSLKDEKFDLILAVGGGSSIDTAKGISVLLTNGGSLGDYFGREVYKIPPVPLFVAPTTVGTGSEVTRACAILNPKTRMKDIVGGASMACRVAFLDGNLLRTLPASVVAATGMDALTHAIEGYTSRNATPVSDALNLHAIRMIRDNLRPAVADSSNIQAIQNMLVASTTTGIGFGNALIGIVHSISHAINGHFEAPHGVLNAIALPHVLEYNWIGNPRKFADIAEALGVDVRGKSVEDAALGGIERVRRLAKDVGIPEKLSDIGIVMDDSKLDEITDQIMTDQYIQYNPRVPRKAEVRRLLEAFL